MRLPVSLLSIFTLIVIGCSDSSPSSGKDDSKLLCNHKGPVSSYDIALAQGITVHDILGCYLPDSATEMRGNISLDGLTWKGYVIATVPEDDFHLVLNKLGLKEQPNLLDTLPDAFECSKDDFNAWDISDTPKGQIYYYEDMGVETYVAVVYTNGTMYAKRQTEYTFVDTSNKVLDFDNIRKLNKGEKRNTGN